MRYRAKRGLVVPMPDRGNTPMPHDGEGAAIDATSPYYARLIADEDIVPVAHAEGDEKGGTGNQNKGAK